MYSLLNFKKDQDAFNEISGEADKTSIDDIRKQLKLIKEEVQELEVEVELEDYEGMTAELVDVMFTTLGLVQKLENKGIDMLGAMKIIAHANLSKFPVVYSEVQRSQDFYKDKGLLVHVSYSDTYQVFVLKDKDSKVRKSVDFIKPDVSSCLPIVFK